MMSDRVTRFWAKAIPEPNSGCWLWTGARDPKGYGLCRFPLGDAVILQRAHRVVYQIERGAIPVGLEIDHLCRNPSCVNPDHLEPVTRRENTLRGNSPKLSAERMKRNRTWLLRKGKA